MGPPAMRGLDQGATLAIACIHLTDIPSLDYQADLFRERSLTNVTANTRRTGEAAGACRHARHQAALTMYDLDRMDQALEDLASGRVTGAAVVRVS